MQDVTVVVLGKYVDIFEGFVKSAEEHIGNFPKVFVRDGNEIPDPPANRGWTVVQGPEKFSMAGNANLGWKAVNPAHDIFYVSDDVRFFSPLPVELMRQAAYSDQRLGIVSPRIKGSACNKVQMNQFLTHLTVTPDPIAFIAVYIKRELIEKIGYLDENFDEYGYDDVDYCRRAQQAGYQLAVTPHVAIIHWDDAHATFKRNPTWPHEKNREYFKRKWKET